MSFLSRIADGFGALIGASSGRNTGESRWWGGASVVAMSGVAVTSDAALQLDVVQAVLERLSGSISTLPIGVFERLADGSKAPAPDHPVARLLKDGPGGLVTSQEFRDEMQRHLGWWRNAYALIIPAPDGRPIGRLEIIHPSRVESVERAGDRVYYRVRNAAPRVGAVTYRDDEIFHIRKAPLTVDGLRGVPVWETARETFGRALAVEQFGALFFANGGSGGGILKHPGNFKSKDDEASFLESWRAGGTGVNRHRDRLLKFGVDYQELKVANDEAQFLETLKEVGAKICRLWNMPPHLVGMLDKATFSNIEQQSIEYVVHTLAPWLAAWEQALSRDLLIGDERDRYFIEFNVAGLLRGDVKARFEAYAQGRQWGWLSVNDIRRLENMNGIGADGDRYLEPLNMSTPGDAPASQGNNPNA